jgi:dihydrodipicolinate synthase/N-acetylneuraminate lyase
VTVLDDTGELIEAEQRALVRFVIQDGYGADVLFAAGTTGEWDRVSNAVRQRVVQVCAEEAAKVSAAQAGASGRGVEVWAGITAGSRAETLANLDFALSTPGVDAAVLAPLSIPGLGDPVRFVARDVADLLDSRSRRIPVYLYDNADIAADPKVPHMRTRQVKALARLDFVRGVKVSAPKQVLGHYAKAAAHFRERGEFGLYVGDAMLIFELFRPPEGLAGFFRDRWNRWLMHGAHPTGVVAGPANVLPREWARAWHVARAGDRERMDEVQAVLEAFRVGTRLAGGRRSIACLKRALVDLGVITSDAVARGTPALARPDAERFDAAFEQVRALARHAIAPPWRTVAPSDEPPARELA